MEYSKKIVEFDKYCKTCEFEKIDEFECPCHECLSEPVNEHSRKPVNYKEKEVK